MVTSPITLTVNNSIVGAPPGIVRVGTATSITGTDPEYEEAYGRALQDRLHQAADWIRCRHEATSTGWHDEDFIRREWAAAQLASKYQAVRDALDWSSGASWEVRPIRYAKQVMWNTENTDFNAPPEYMWRKVQSEVTSMSAEAYEKFVAHNLKEQAKRQQKQRFKDQLRINRPDNHVGNPLRSFDSSQLFDKATPAEIKALQLLRKMVSTEQFRRYLRHGFIVVSGGATGLVYQVHIHKRIKVWKMGEPIADLCIHLNYDSKTPPTDHVVGKMLMVEGSESEVWTRSNITWAKNYDAALEEIHLLGIQPPKEQQTTYVNGGVNVVLGNIDYASIERYMVQQVAKMRAAI